jgi:hypothetical protein
VWLCVYVCVCVYTYIACFEEEKKAQKFSPPAAGETPDPCHLSGPEMISYTSRHHTPGLAGGRRRRHERAHTNTHVRARACTHTYTLTHVHLLKFIFTHKLICLPAHSLTHSLTHTHTHTRTHTCTNTHTCSALREMGRRLKPAASLACCMIT